jgi:hypothetical protein
VLTSAQHASSAARIFNLSRPFRFALSMTLWPATVLH